MKIEPVAVIYKNSNYGYFHRGAGGKWFKCVGYQPVPKDFQKKLEAAYQELKNREAENGKS